MRIHIALALALAMILGAACPQTAAWAAEDGSYAAASEADPESYEAPEGATKEEAAHEAEEEAPAGATAEEIIPEADEEIPAEEAAEEPAPEKDAEEEIPAEAATEAAAEEATLEEAEAQEQALQALEAAEAALPQNGIPLVIIEIDESEGNNTIEEMNASEDHSVKCTGTMQIIVPEGFTYCDTDTAPESLGPVKLEYIRGRGQTTWEYPKKPYRIRLEKKANVLGLGENKHWVLLANSLDTTVIKDRLAGVLGDRIGFEYTPNGVPVDVVMVARKDGAEVSRESLGSYLLAEQIRVDKKRVNIPELTAEDTAPEDITGGYLLAYGHQLFRGDPDKFYTDHGQQLANDSPSFDPSDDDYTNEEQKAYIRDHIQKMENAMYGEGSYGDGDDPFVGSEGVRYNEYADMESAAKYWLFQEVAANWDGYGSSSTYFYKKPDQFDGAGNLTEMGKVCWGPLWDFDVSFGDGERDENIEGFSFIDDKWLAPMLYDGAEDGFRRTAQRLWPEVRDAVLDAISDGGLVDRYYEETKSSYEADYEIWKDSTEYYDGRREDYRENIDVLKAWTRDRIAWLDAHMGSTSDDGFDPIDSAVARVTFVADGDTVRREYYPKGAYCSLSGPSGPGAGGFKPSKEGYVFVGWLDEEGNLMSGGENIEEDRIFTASFVADGEATTAEEIIFRSEQEACSLKDEYFSSKFTILPRDAQDKTLTWTSSDETVATVDERGEVHLLATGFVTITATSGSGATASYELLIVEEQPVPEDLILDTVRIELSVGDHAKIRYRVEPSDAKAEDIRFLPDDEDVASVDSNGVVFGLEPGRTMVTVRLRYIDEDGEFVSIEKECAVVVYGDEPGGSKCGPGGHDLVKREAIEPGCTQEGATEYWVCLNCGKLFSDAEGQNEIAKSDTVLGALGHDWGDWEVVRKATAEEEGLEESVCRRCGATRERAIPKLAARSRDETDTGDRSRPGLWILLAVAALAGIGGVIFMRRK